MTDKKIDGFIQDIITTPALFTGLTEAIGKQQGATACAAVSTYASANGYAVSAEDAANARTRILDAVEGSRTLSDGDLEGVSGGISLDSLFGNHAPNNPILNVAKFVGRSLDDVVDFFKQW